MCIIDLSAKQQKEFIIMRKFITYFSLLRRLLKTNRSDILLENPTEQDKKDLALGRWQTFKIWFCPEFVLKMTSDDESILNQVCLHQACKTRTGGVLNTIRPVGNDYLEATKLMISYCLECHQHQLLMQDFITLLTKETK